MLIFFSLPPNLRMHKKDWKEIYQLLGFRGRIMWVLFVFFTSSIFPSFLSRACIILIMRKKNKKTKNVVLSSLFMYFVDL